MLYWFSHFYYFLFIWILWRSFVSFLELQLRQTRGKIWFYFWLNFISRIFYYESELLYLCYLFPSLFLFLVLMLNIWFRWKLKTKIISHQTFIINIFLSVEWVVDWQTTQKEKNRKIEEWKINEDTWKLFKLRAARGRGEKERKLKTFTLLHYHLNFKSLPYVTLLSKKKVHSRKIHKEIVNKKEKQLKKVQKMIRMLNIKFWVNS